MKSKESQLLISRIALLIKELKLSDRKFAISAGVSPARLSKILAGTNPGADVLLKIGDAIKNLNMDWLLRGKGEMFLKPVIKPAPGAKFISLVTQKAAAGFIGNYTDPEYIENLPAIQLPGISTGTAFEVKGDSMEPEVYDRDILTCIQLPDLQSIKTDRTYVLVCREHGIVIKRVKNTLKEAKEFLLISRNRLYKPFTVKAEDVLSVWKIVKIIKPYRDVPAYEEKLQAVEQLLREIKNERG